MNCWLVLTAIDDDVGEIVIELKLLAAAVTVNAADPCTLPDFAEMVTVPGFDPVAVPLEAMLAIVESEEFH